MGEDPNKLNSVAPAPCPRVLLPKASLAHVSMRCGWMYGIPGDTQYPLSSLHVILSGSPGHSAYLQSQQGGKCKKLQHSKAYICLEMSTGTSITTPDITSMLMWFQRSSVKLLCHKTCVMICELEITVGKKKTNTSLVKCWLFKQFLHIIFFFPQEENLWRASVSKGTQIFSVFFNKM